MHRLGVRDIDRLALAREHPEGDHGAPCHSSIKVNLDTYGHLFPTLDEALTEGLDEQSQNTISIASRPVCGLRSEISPVLRSCGHMKQAPNSL